MKTLKFMLAAATAIGLASASQAVGPTLGSTSFESYDAGAITATTDANLFTLPTGWEEGDYTIVTDDLPDCTRSAGATSAFGASNLKSLKLEGGTSPLELKINKSSAATALSAGDLYVDTLVKFTVTPSGDSVETTASDKLLIYLQEDLTEGSEATNLVVKAAYYDGQNVTARAFVLNAGKDILPGGWYRLTVKAINNVAKTSTWVGFTIAIDGVDCTSAQLPFDPNEAATLLPFLGSDYLADLQNGKIFLSLLGLAGDATISTVGFAGSGTVDDVLITTFDPALTVLDFYLVLEDPDNKVLSATYQTTDGQTTPSTVDSGTLNVGTNMVYCYSSNPAVSVSFTAANGYKGTWDTDPNDATITKGAIYTLTIEAEITSVDFTFALGTGVSGVTWTLNGTTQSGLTAQVAEGDVLAITGVTYADWYVGTGDYVKNWTKTLAAADVAENFTYTVAAEKATGPVIIADSTTAADLGITNPKFANDSAAQLSKLATWAQSLTTPLTIAQVNAMTFADGDLNSEAFLLNCENSAEAVAAAKAEFKFSAITPGTVPSVDTPARGYNVEPVIYGGATLDAITVTPATSAHKFYKAVLTK